MPHIDRVVFNMGCEYVVGWPCIFSMNGTPEDDIIATRFYCNSPCPGAFRIHKCVSTRHAEIEFSRPEMPYDTIATFPGLPFDPFYLPRPARINPVAIGPSRRILDISDVRMRIEHTGVVPHGMKAGDKSILTVMFIGQKG